MAAPRKTSSEETTRVRRRPPAKTPEEYENVLIVKALGEIERQIDRGTASSQLLSHYAQLASSRERLQQERLKMEIELLEKKAEAMESAKRVEELYEGAIAAMRSYGGHDPGEHLEDLDDDY